MPQVVVYLAIFIGLGIFFLFFHLMLGKLVRPIEPESDKLTIYECGEPTVGTAWVQFDLRYYVVALLFVIFDVEVAFFFPWAVVFGNANSLARPSLAEKDRTAISKQLIPGNDVLLGTTPAEVGAITEAHAKGIDAVAAHQFARLGFVDIIVFFGVLLVGFAYLWKRGDINWVRSVASERLEPTITAVLTPTREEALMHR